MITPLRRVPSRIALVVTVAATCPSGLTAQARPTPKDSVCIAYLAQLTPAIIVVDANAAGACRRAAFALVDARMSQAIVDALKAIPARDFQSRAGNAGSTSGSVAQIDAVPAIQPVAVAGGAVAATGSGSGNNTIATFTLNPTILFGTPTDKAKAAKLSRMLDLSVLLPINDLDKNKDGTIDYFGARLRLNFASGDVAEKLSAALDPVVHSRAELNIALTQQFADTATKPACISAYMAAKPVDADIRTACGRVIDLYPADVLEHFRTAVAAARDSVDSRYFGLDVRLDKGDPTLGGTPGASGTTLFAGLAFGRQMIASNPTAPTFGFKGRVGVQNISLDDTTVTKAPKNQFALDAAFAFDFIYPSDFQPLVVAAGLEYKARNPAVPDADGTLRTHFFQARLSIDIPISSGNSISIGLATPLTSKEKPVLSINMNWQMLMSALSGAK